ncbi:MAG: iron-containing alcohol dehydrogenase [Alphaproteobacteria bacterium]|nr:iron-containing alcohol dehydrogenase [Alphaproteobacteria bacterium]
MQSLSQLTDPTDLEGLRRELSQLDPDGRLAPLDMQRVVIAEDAHLRVRESVAEAVSAVDKTGRPSIVILTDKTPIERAGQRLSLIIQEQLKDDFAVRLETLDDGHEKLHADETVIDMAANAVNGADGVVTIGSGTMTDIGKMACRRNGGLPQVAVQTAASVDGFTDNVSVVLRNGVKRTVPSAWPTVVLADVTTIGTAPRELNTSGFGEAISLFTAPADWYLSHLIGLDHTFHPASMAMLKAAAAEPPRWSAGVATGEAHATHELTRLLALRGIVSGISNTTACLSGVEHVISHMLDLHNGAKHLPIGLHGEQVGVASLVAAKLWREAIESDLIGPGRLAKPDHAVLENRVRTAFGHLGDAIAAECWRDCQAKHRKLADNWERLESTIANWRRNVGEFDGMVTSPETLRPALKASGAPASFADLSCSVSPDLAYWATANCFLMRNRFNLVDLLDLLGLWTDERVTWALDSVLGGAA